MTPVSCNKPGQRTCDGLARTRIRNTGLHKRETEIATVAVSTPIQPRIQFQSKAIKKMEAIREQVTSRQMQKQARDSCRNRKIFSNRAAHISHKSNLQAQSFLLQSFTPLLLPPLDPGLIYGLCRTSKTQESLPSASKSAIRL